MYFSENETIKFNEKMISIAEEILKKQEQDGGYKREYTKNDLFLGNGYEGEYFEYPYGTIEELGKEAGLPLTMIEDYLEKDINKIYEENIAELSNDNTVYKDGKFYPEDYFK